MPDRFAPALAGREHWPGILAGLGGLALMAAVETFSGAVASQPVARYEPSPPHLTAVAASPELAFMVTPKIGDLEQAFRDAGYDLENVRKHSKPVPRLRLTTLPSGLDGLRNIKRRKELFLALTLPMVLEANAHIAAERRRLLLVVETVKSGQPLPPEVESWLTGLAERYKTDPDRLDVLLRRVDTVPVSLCLAQAAIESGWGTSRFAIEGNAIFGQWTTAGGRGIVPAERAEGMTHKIRSFDRLSDSVAAYLLNLNTHRAYRKLRAMREEARTADKPVTGVDLTASLMSYSEKGADYVDLLRGVIRVNRLAPLDDAILGDQVVTLEKDA